MPVLIADDREACESENEYHDAMSELKDLTEKVDIKKDHNNPKVVFTDTRYTDD